MKLKIQAPRGTQDILPSKAPYWDMVETELMNLAQVSGFERLEIPTLEYTELFSRSVGEGTDVVQKEMFTFSDRGGRSLTLRPEGTAGVLRAVLQNGLLQNCPLPLKLCYLITCFRNERPQAGRLKEFHQFGVELFGSADPSADAELIFLAAKAFEKLGIPNIKLQLNSIGCTDCRAVYREALKAYFKPELSNMCDTCQQRFTQNPLRLLDCKNDSCAKVASKAPSIADYLCEECSAHFRRVCELLDCLGISYTCNPSMVRGLDYYNRTVFEFTSEDLGAQSAVCGGGRYDGLVESMGGPAQPALGFAIGLERLLSLWHLAHPEQGDGIRRRCQIYLAHRGDEAQKMAMKLALSLREKGVYAEFDSAGKSLKAQMKQADKLQAAYSCVIGEEEIKSGKAAVKNMESGESETLSLEKIAEPFSSLSRD